MERTNQSIRQYLTALRSKSGEGQFCRSGTIAFAPSWWAPKGTHILSTLFFSGINGGWGRTSMLIKFLTPD